ncbi:MAG: hypothetical protein IIC49_01830 [Planctomycetes bacterium]|nr:hypothetical protein [Planctomycetota bacterium]
MIFVTVGAQMPFDRMVRCVDEWATKQGRRDVVAQIGPTRWRPRSIEWTEFLSPTQFLEHVKRANVIIAHAGMGSILTALQFGKPIVIMPRRGDLAETRNDHQLATAARFEGKPGVFVAQDETELSGMLDRLDSLVAGEPISEYASPELLNAIKAFIHDQP